MHGVLYDLGYVTSLHVKLGSKYNHVFYSISLLGHSV